MEAAEQYITMDFLEEQLKTNVDSFSISSGSNAGDNYTSVMYAIDVRLKSGETKSLIMKAYPSHPARQGFLTMTNIFLKEVRVYEEYIPALANLDKDIKLAFAPYISGKAVNYRAPGADMTSFVGFLENYVLMEDIRKTSGFAMADRRKGLNFEHAKLVIQELSKFHAASLVYSQVNGLKTLTEKFEFLKDDTFTEDMIESFKPMMDDTSTKALTHIRNELGPNSPAYLGIDKVLGWEDIGEKMVEFYKHEGVDEAKVESWLRVPPEADNEYNYEPWLVGLHGDCWLNNMLFRYKDDHDREKPEEVILVDLQISRQGCPTSDLVYFLVASTPCKVRRKHETEFLEIYYNEFNRTCDRFATQYGPIKPLPGFSLQSLKRRYRRSKFFGLTMGITLLQIVLQDPVDAMDLETLGADKKDIGDVFQSAIGSTKKQELIQEQLGGLAQELFDDGIV